MTLASPRYALPNKHHDVVEDINNLRTTLRTVDSDIHSIESSIPELSERVPQVQSTVLCIESNLANSEIQNIEPNRYLVVNRNGDGFEFVESGGEPGGETGQCSIKKSDKNVDIAWGNILDVSKNGMTVQENAEASKKNETHIFVDEAEIENDEQLPKVELTNYQVKSDVELENNSAVIICDAIEKTEEKAIEIATNQNYGLVKVGNGFTNNAGTISAPIIEKATKTSVGIIKTGNGLNNGNGVISRADLDPATFSDFGVIKLGNGLSINANDEMEISDMSGATIYDLGRVKTCNNGIVELEESTLRYRLFVTENILIQIKADFYVRDDFSFVLEVVSSGTHLLVFNENLNPNMTELPVNRGTTKISFTKKMGVSAYDIEISRLDAPDPVLLTPAIDSCITSEFSITAPNGGSDMPNYLLWTNHNVWDYRDIPELNFNFETLVCVDYVNYVSNLSTVPLDNFILKGSNDGKNWTTLIYKTNEVVYGKIYTEVKGCFRYFNLKIGYNSNDNKPSGVTLWGTQIDNNESEITPITPYMGSNETTFATMTTSNNIVEGSASSITDNSSGSYLIMEKTDDNWVKYEFPTAQVANILELNYWFQGSSWSYNGDRQPNWFRLFGSNDDENWTLLLERQYQGRALEKDNYVLFFSFDNSTAYKYYKYVCVATHSDDSRWNICGLKLYRRSVGKHNFYNLVPALSSATQDGYDVTASSVWNNDSGHQPFYVFDGASNTKWASSGTGTQWLQIKLPTATICNVVKIVSRSDADCNNQAPKDFEIQGSNNAETWTTLTSQTDISWTSTGQSQSFSFENESAYLYYRLLITANNGGSDYSLGEFVVGRNAYEYKRLLNKYEYSVPAMSSSSQSGYAASADSRYDSNYQAWKAFDRSSSTSWTSGDATSTTPHWLKIYNNDGISANCINIIWHSGHYGVDYVISGSDDDTTYTDLVTVTDNNNLNPSYNLSNIQTFKYWKVYITRINTNKTRAEIHQFNLVNKSTVQEY